VYNQRNSNSKTMTLIPQITRIEPAALTAGVLGWKISPLMETTSEAQS